MKEVSPLHAPPAQQDIIVQEVPQVHPFYRYRVLVVHTRRMWAHPRLMYAYGVAQDKIRQQALLHLQRV